MCSVAHVHMNESCVVCGCLMLQCVAVRCRVLLCVSLCYNVLQCVAVRCSVLQCVAVRYSVLQCVAVWCSVLQHTATHCNTLQHTARLIHLYISWHECTRSKRSGLSRFLMLVHMKSWVTLKINCKCDLFQGSLTISHGLASIAQFHMDKHEWPF